MGEEREGEGWVEEERVGNDWTGAMVGEVWAGEGWAGAVMTSGVEAAASGGEVDVSEAAPAGGPRTAAGSAAAVQRGQFLSWQEQRPHCISHG